MKHWTDYRWNEGILSLTSHPDYNDYISLQVISKRTSDFYWLSVWPLREAF